MSESGEDRNPDRLSELPKWPDEAKELPENRSTEPPRTRLQWALSFGAIGAVLTLFRATGGRPPFENATPASGFLAFALIGLAVESVVAHRERKRRKFHD